MTWQTWLVTGAHTGFGRELAPSEVHGSSGTVQEPEEYFHFCR